MMAAMLAAVLAVVLDAACTVSFGRVLCFAA